MALFQYFDQDDIEQIHATVLRLMNEVGIRFPYEAALQVLRKAGCRVEGDRVHFPAKIVENAVRKAPSKFTLYGRTPDLKVEIGGDNVVYLPCYGAPIVEDIKEGRRDATLEDLIRFIKLNHTSQLLPIIGGPMVEPNDVPASRRTAEVLSGITLAQLVREGTPVVFSGSSSCANLRDGLLASGAPELGIFAVAAAQMGRFYDLPVRAGGASTDSKTVDVQAGYESMSNLLLSTLSGVNFVLLAAGVLDSYMVSSFEKFMVDEEMISMCQRIRRGERITPERLAYDVIVEVAEKGDFLSHPHTLEHFRTELHDPGLSFRSSYYAWVEKECPDILERAHHKWKQRLNNFQAPDLSPELEKDLRKYVDNITAE